MTLATEVRAPSCGVDTPSARPPSLSAERAAHLSRGYKALGDPTRLQLLSMIAAHDGGTACVCELTGPLALSQPTISHHLRVLREAGLVTSERRGTWVHYSLVPDALRELGVLDAVAAR